MHMLNCLRVSCLLIVALVPLAVCAQETPQGITVIGTGKVAAAPDVAYVEFTVSSQDAEVGAAAQANAAAADKLIARLKAFGIPADKLQTTNYSVSPRIDFKQASSMLVGYSVSNTVKVTLGGLDRIGELIDAGVEAGATSVGRVTFGLDDTSKLEREALLEAIRNAETKAQTAADALNVKLGQAISMVESGAVQPRPLGYAAARSEAAATPIIPGDVDVTATVTVTYAIL